MNNFYRIALFNIKYKIYDNNLNIIKIIFIF